MPPTRRSKQVSHLSAKKGMPSWPSSGAPARSLCRLTDVNKYPCTPHRNVAAAPGIELRLHENLFRASVEVCKVSAACQWHSCKLFQLCRSICAKSTSLNCSWTMCITLNTMSKAALHNHLPFTLTPRLSKGKTGHTSCLKHSSVV